LIAKNGRIASLLLGGLLTLHTVQPARASIEELADPSLPDIAAVSYQPGEAPVILYNPLLCRQAGHKLCEFYRFHEYGHIALHHYERTDISPQEKEAEADRWAAQHAPLRAVIAAWQFFTAGGGSTPIHGDSATRAARLMAARGLLLFASRPHGKNEFIPLNFNALAL